MKTIYSFTILLLLILSVVSCKKEQPEPDNQPETPTGTTTTPVVFTFEKLEAEKTTIAKGETVKITATATGKDLTYTWSATQGDIIGSGTQITYGASPCCAGTPEVTCIVKDAENKQETKTIIIAVQ